MNVQRRIVAQVTITLTGEEAARLFTALNVTMLNRPSLAPETASVVEELQGHLTGLE